MIIKDFFNIRKDGVKLYRTYSSENFYIKKANTNEIYIDAIDVEDANFNYIETDIIIKKQEDDEEVLG